MWRAIAIAMFVMAGCSEERTAPARDEAPGAAERASYDRYRRPDLLVAALALGPGDVVADVGAGRGYLSGRLADAVGPTGRVVATDIDRDALAAIAPRANLETRHVRADDPGLEAGAYDLVLLAEVDHYLADRADYFARLGRTLKPGGRLAICNRRVHGEAARAALARAGFEVIATPDELPAHHLILARRSP